MANAGLEVFSATGRLRFSATDRLTRYLGSVVVSSSTGSFVDGRLTSGGDVWMTLLMSDLFGRSGLQFDHVGNVISWAPQPGGASTFGGILIYGLY